MYIIGMNLNIKININEYILRYILMNKYKDIAGSKNIYYIF